MRANESRPHLGIVLFLFSVIGALGCRKEPPGPDGGVPDAGPQACSVDSDCPDPRLFFCSSTTFRCEPACRVPSDCDAVNRGDFPLPYCSGPLGCLCDVGRCVKRLCSSDVECRNGTVCRDGDCVPPPDAAAASCQLVPDRVVARAGERVRFHLLARDATGRPVVPASTLWAVSTGQRGAGATQPLQADVELLTPTAGMVEVVKATAGAASCRALAQVLPDAVAPGTLRAVVTDELTGRPIPGVVVALSSSASDGGTLAQASTDASGIALLPTPLGEVTVSAFHEAFGYLTIAGYDAASGSRDLALALRRNVADQSGGSQGTFRSPPPTPHVHAGIAGMSLLGSLADLTPQQLVGPASVTGVRIGTTFDKPLPLPSGAYLAVGDAGTRTHFTAPGVASVCTQPFDQPSAEAAIQAGSCGTQAAWGFSSDIPIASLPLDALAGGAGNINWSTVLARSVPLFKDFSASVVRDVELPLRPVPLADGGTPDTSGTEHFVPVDHDFRAPPSFPLSFAMVADVPALPRDEEGVLDGLVLLGGASVPGRGFVPLGLGAAVVTGSGPLTDPQAGLGKAGKVAVRMAPATSGLEGSDYAFVALALPLRSANEPAVGFSTSALVQRLATHQLWFDPLGDSPLQLSGQFLPVPRGARYNFLSTPQADLLGRQLRFSDDQDLAGATLVRATFTDRRLRTWTVLLDPLQALSGFRLPLPPTGFDDRTFYAPGEPSRASMQVQSLRLNTRPSLGGSPVGFTELVELNGIDLDRLAELTEAFAVLDLGRPAIEWLVPSPGATVAPGSELKVRVTGFRVGIDGQVQFSFGSCAASPVWVSVDPSQGKGEISTLLPTNCRGSVTVKAQLYDISTPPQPLAPVVVGARDVAIQ